MQPLPIDSRIPEIVTRLREHTSVVVQAPPGSGKTTRVPPAMLDALGGEIWVLEPRRIAARLAARRVAFERGERAGQTAGYQVRFEEVAGPQTRLRFMTEGVLARRMISNPDLRGVSAVVVDEFHERHLEGDVALALLRRLQLTTRPDLRLAVMSATLDPAPLVRYFGGDNRCPVVSAEGRLFDLDIEHAPYTNKPLEEQVAGALERLLKEGTAGDVLIFLPGAAEIRRAARACEPLGRRANFIVLPLHGDLSPEDQDRAVAPAEQRKVILSTNVAESSITIEGVRAVIDSGLARVASDSPWTGLPRLEIGRISKASAAQRAGRAGRTGPGRVIRLFSAEDFARRADYDAPEITRRELSHTLLDLKAMCVDELPWFEPPPAEALSAAEDLLRRLHAIDGAGRLTNDGAEMSRLPLHPRLARLVLEAKRRGAAHSGYEIAALLSAGDRLDSQRPPAHAAPSDLLLLLESDWSPAARRIYQQLVAQASRPVDRPKADSEEAVLIATLAAFPDRVARRRVKSGGSEAELMLAAGGSALLASNSAVQSELLVAVDVEERPDRGLPLVRLASAVEPEWLLDLFPERVRERAGVEWNRTAERVETASVLLYDELVIEETRGGAPDPEEAARLLASKAWEAGVARFAAEEEISAFTDRVSFAAQHGAVPALGEAELKAALELLAVGLRTFKDLQAAARDGGLIRELKRRLGGAAQKLDQIAPESIRLPRGRQVRVHYPPGQPPWIASRLQDFFGMRETPRVGGGKVPVAVRLLAPSNRPVQITSDLRGFWERHYPDIRRELSRRYPRHAWPEDPTRT